MYGYLPSARKQRKWHIQNPSINIGKAMGHFVYFMAKWLVFNTNFESYIASLTIDSYPIKKIMRRLCVCVYIYIYLSICIWWSLRHFSFKLSIISKITLFLSLLFFHSIINSDSFILSLKKSLLIYKLEDLMKKLHIIS